MCSLVVTYDAIVYFRCESSRVTRRPTFQTSRKTRTQRHLGRKRNAKSMSIGSYLPPTDFPQLVFSPIDIASILPRKDDFFLKPTHLSTVAIDGEEFTKTDNKILDWNTYVCFRSPLGFVHYDITPQIVI